MLQGLVANVGDGWEWFLTGLAEFFEAVVALPAPEDGESAGFAKDGKAPDEVLKHAAKLLDAAALLGRRTAEMHLALATPTSDPAFAAEPFVPEDLKRDSLRIEEQLASTFEALKSKLPTLTDEVADEAALLLSRRRAMLERARAIADGEAAGQRIRIHGDYHLGQTLRTENAAAGAENADFVLLDFEGEPARPLAERRRKQSPLKDVAGMVRSFSYAAGAGLEQFLAVHSERSGAAENLRGWARAWERAASAEFLRAYRKKIAAASGLATGLLPPPERAQALFTAYLLEKALYELLYELNNRPTWLRIPIGGILSM